MAKPSRAPKPATTFVPSTPASVPAGFKTKRMVTLPTLSMKTAGSSYAVRILDAMRVSALKNTKKVAGKEMEPATVCSAINLETGEQVNMILPAVVKGNLEEQYEDDSYVGKCFLMTNNGKREGKKYNDFSIIEIEAE